MKKILLSLLIFCSVLLQAQIQIPQVVGLTSALNSKVDKVTGKSLVADTLAAKIQPHVTNLSNPHNVTKAQVGLSNVDNTSDASKPISTATQTALDGKQLIGTYATGTGTASGTNTGDETLTSIKTKLGAATSVSDGYLKYQDFVRFDGKQPAGAYLTAEVDGSTTNELNSSSAWDNFTNTISVTDAGGAKSAVITGFLESEVDGSTTNELQTISTTGAAGNITLSNSGGTLNLNVNDADASPTNEIQDLSLSGNILTLSSDAPVDISQATAVQANTAKVSNATHTGDVTGSTALTLATVNSNIGTFNNITINAKGLATAGSNVSYEPAFSKNTGFNKNFGTTPGTVLEGRTFGTAASSAVGDFIQNQNDSPQTANIFINGDSESKSVKTSVNGSLILQRVPSLPAPTVSENGVGILTGTYQYSVSAYTALGETDSPVTSTPITVSSKSILLSNIPIVSDSRVIGRRIYRNAASALDIVYRRLVVDIPNNTATTYVDNIADASLGGYMKWLNTTGGEIFENNTRIFSSGGVSMVMGQNSMLNNQGYANTIFGGNSMTNATYARRDAMFGLFAGYSITTGSNNTGVGVHALNYNQTGNDNCAVGYTSLMNNLGASNTAIGMGSLASNATGNALIGIGYMAGYYETGTNKLYIDALDRGNEANGKIKSLIYGEFNSTPSSQLLRVNGNVETLNLTASKVSVNLLGYTPYMTVNYTQDNALEIGINGKKLITSGNYDTGEILNFWTNNTKNAYYDYQGNFIQTRGTANFSSTVTATQFNGSAAGLTSFPTLNQSTTGSAATLTTTRTIWGQSFNGSANISGAITGATTGSFSGVVTASSFSGSGSNLTGVQLPITLTTNGTSGAATFGNGVLNVPNYTQSTPYSYGAYSPTVTAITGISSIGTNTSYFTNIGSIYHVSSLVGLITNVAINETCTVQITLPSTPTASTSISVMGVAGDTVQAYYNGSSSSNTIKITFKNPVASGAGTTVKITADYY